MPGAPQLNACKVEGGGRRCHGSMWSPPLPPPPLQACPCLSPSRGSSGTTPTSGERADGLGVPLSPAVAAPPLRVRIAAGCWRRVRACVDGSSDSATATRAFSCILTAWFFLRSQQARPCTAPSCRCRPPVDWMLIDGLDEFGGQPGQDLARVVRTAGPAGLATGTAGSAGQRRAQQALHTRPTWLACRHAVGRDPPSHCKHLCRPAWL